MIRRGHVLPSNFCFRIILKFFDKFFVRHFLSDPVQRVVRTQDHRGHFATRASRRFECTASGSLCSHAHGTAVAVTEALAARAEDEVVAARRGRRGEVIGAGEATTK